MIIHDVKHPTTALIEVFKNMQADFIALESLLENSVCKPLQELMQQIS